MENKIKILICDDQEADHKIIKKKFIQSTFLNNNVEVVSIYYYKTAPKKQAALLDLINDSFDYNILFLDLNFIPEGINEEDDKNKLIDDVLMKLKSISRDILLVAISNDGANRSDIITSQGVPLIDKSADPTVIAKFLKFHYGWYIKSLIIGSSFSDIQVIKESVFNNENMILLMGNKYLTQCLLAHLEEVEYYTLFDDVPHIKHDANNFRFEIDVNLYFKELAKNGKWRDEIKKWENRLENFIIAHLLTEYCEIDGNTKDNYSRLISNSAFIWDTSIVSDFNLNESAIPHFLKKLNTRRLIAFLYLLCNYDQEKIYILLKGKMDNNNYKLRGEKTISNPLRYSYFLSGISGEEINVRKRTYNKVREQLWDSEKKLLLKIAENVINKVSQLQCSFNRFDMESLKKEMNNLKFK